MSKADEPQLPTPAADTVPPMPASKAKQMAIRDRSAGERIPARYKHRAVRAGCAVYKDGMSEADFLAKFQQHEEVVGLSLETMLLLANIAMLLFKLFGSKASGQMDPRWRGPLGMPSREVYAALDEAEVPAKMQF